MRGKGVQPRDKRVAVGITPACAGKRGQPPSGPCCRWDHPRVCGEKSMMSRVVFCTVGSPPRVRGKVQLQPWQPTALGITPAYAGKSRSQPRTAPRHRDHPRVCGEKMSRPPAKTRTPGLPPRMRGKDEQTTGKNENARITPAYAGKRSQGVAALQLGWDHPRVCGEKQSRQRCRMSRTGSPPRVRGKGISRHRVALHRGITPAYAGKRSPARLFLYLPGDHPRVCGEKSTTSEDAGSLPGSPPRMRGKV